MRNVAHGWTAKEEVGAGREDGEREEKGSI